MGEQMLDENIQGQVREFFNDLVEPVAILFFGSQDEARCQYCEPAAQLLTEVASLSDKLTLQKFDIDQDAEIAAKYNVDSVPSFVLAAKEGEDLVDYGVRFKGIPAGHEFTTLVNDLVILSRRDSGLSPETREFLKSLEKPVHLQVFVTPT